MLAPLLQRARTYRPNLWARFFFSESWKLVLSERAADRIRLKLETESELFCLDISDVSTAKALLWHRVEIRSKGRVDVLSGLTAKAAYSIRDDLRLFVNQHLAELIASDKERLRDVGWRGFRPRRGQRRGAAW